MKVLLVSNAFWPERGGVEQHLQRVLPELLKLGWQICLLTKEPNSLSQDTIAPITSSSKIAAPSDLARQQWQKTLAQITLVRWPAAQPNQHLWQTWWQLRHYGKLFRHQDVIIVHDIFIEVFPWRLVLPHKRWITVFHGWETHFPLPWKNIFYKRLAQFFSHATLSIGSYINQFYGLSSHHNQISYGVLSAAQLNFLQHHFSTNPTAQQRRKLLLNWQKRPIDWLFLGRLSEDTGLPQFLAMLTLLRHQQPQLTLTVKFCGSGPLASRAAEFGEVMGMVEPDLFLAQSRYCFVGGYLSALEAVAYGCQIFASFDQTLKQEYWQTSPFVPFLQLSPHPAQLAKQFRDLETQPEVAQQALLQAQFGLRHLTAHNLAKQYQKAVEMALCQ